MNPRMQLSAVSSVCRGWEGVNLPARGNCAASDWFNATAYLGKRGHRFLSVPVKYVLAAAQQISDRIRGGAGGGLYLGTASADTAHRIGIMKGLLEDANALPGAASAPGASVNSPAGALARTYGLHGPVMTLTGGDDSGLICLWQAAAAMARGEVVSCVVGQVEHVPGHSDESGAVLWSLTTPDKPPFDDAQGKDALADVTVERWERIAPADTETLACRLKAERGPVTLIAQAGPGIAGLVTGLNLRRAPDAHIEFLSADRLSGAVVPDIQLFSLLTLAILSGSGGRILILSRRGHLFNLTVQLKGMKDA